MWTVAPFVPSSVSKPSLGTLTASDDTGFTFSATVNLRRPETISDFLVQVTRAKALADKAAVVPMKGPQTLSAWCAARLNA